MSIIAAWTKAAFRNQDESQGRAATTHKHRQDKRSQDGRRFEKSADIRWSPLRIQGSLEPEIECPIILKFRWPFEHVSERSAHEQCCQRHRDYLPDSLHEFGYHTAQCSQRPRST